MNRFLLFAGQKYYPGLAFENFVDSFKEEKEALEKAEQLKDEDWVQVVDTLNRTFETYMWPYFDHEDGLELVSQCDY